MSQPGNGVSSSSNVPIPPSDTLHIVASEITAQNKVHVTLNNGRTYEITVHQGQKEVSGALPSAEWKRIYDKIFQYFEAATGKREFVSTQITLRGASAITSAADLETKNVRIVGEPSAIAYDDAGNQQSIRLPERSQSVAFNRLEQLANNYRGQATYSPVAASAAPQPYENIIEDDRLKICDGRSHTVVSAPAPAPAPAPGAAQAPPPPQLPQDLPHAYHALADQLSKMPKLGFTNWNGQPVETIVNELCTEIPAHIHTIMAGPIPAQQQWVESNIRDISKSLNDARLSDKLRLLYALGKHNTTRRTHNLPEITSATLDIWCTKSSSTCTPNEKATLVDIYTHYISDRRSKFVGTTFFKIFVEIHEGVTKQDQFQIVLIRENADGTKYATSFPDRDIETDKCAFIHIDAVGKYSSYDRGANPTGALPDLNNKKPVSSTLRVKKTPIAAAEPVTYMPLAPSTIPSLSSPPSAAPISAPAAAAAPPREPTPEEFETIEVDARGNCLDKSVAYQIMKKQGIENPKASDQQGKLEETARGFRTETARYIRETAALNDDIKFMDLLAISIGDMTESVPDNIRTILSQGKRASSNLEEARIAKDTLRQFYATHIVKASSYLDSPFLFALTKLNPDLNIVVMRGTEIQVKFPLEGILNINNTMFINYNGTNHHRAIDKNNENNKTKIAKVFVQDFMNYVALANSDPRIIKEKLRQMKQENLQAYGIIARLIYDNDVASWERSHYLDKPGTISLTDHMTGRTYHPGEYAEFRIDTAREDELKTLLVNLADNIRNLATLREAPRG